jgi:hypothetical protein
MLYITAYSIKKTSIEYSQWEIRRESKYIIIKINGTRKEGRKDFSKRGYSTKIRNEREDITTDST